MNVVDVYQRWGVTGRGTVVSILDDGIEKDHPDLVKNYVRHVSDLFLVRSSCPLYM